MRTLLFLVLSVAVTASCACPAAKPDRASEAQEPAKPPAPSSSARVVAVPSGHPLYSRVEGIGHANDCAKDADCKTGGCSGEVCSAAEGINTTCEIQQWPTQAASCGCVDKQCVWYQGKAKEAASGLLPGQGRPCEADACKSGLTCVTYHGIAGPSGPKFSSCEVPCSEGEAACPAGQKCITVVDGPGQVCRPMT